MSTNLGDTIVAAHAALTLARRALGHADNIAVVDDAIAKIEAMNTQGVAVEILAKAVVMLAEQQGMVLTIEQRPLQPLSMGHYETVVSVRPARVKA